MLVPIKRFLAELPWVGVVVLLALAGYRLGGLRLAALQTFPPLHASEGLPVCLWQLEDRTEPTR